MIVWEADIDSAGRFTFVSQRAEELLGYPARPLDSSRSASGTASSTPQDLPQAE